MTTSADRILANLPPTFAPLPRPTAISTLADAFGGQLLQAENSLAAVMFAHWVDYADAGADTLTDLAAIAALYGLKPRDDETIEEFRQHLKRYVLTFLNGTVTVRGICRIVADALGLVVADDQLDTWWNRRPSSLLSTVDAAGDDAATLLFGVPAVLVRGTAARPATFSGSVDLSRPVDLRGRSLLSIAIAGAAATTFDLAAHLDPASADIGAIVGALGAVTGIVAENAGGRLAIQSATAGATSTLELADIPGDAAPAILGIQPHAYTGTAEVQAQIVGTVELGAALDMTTQRYLRLVIDGTSGHEIDCAAANAAATLPADIVHAIQEAAGAGVAALDPQGRLTVSSPTPGLAGTVALLTPTAGDATRLLFGDAATYARGRDPAPAQVSGTADLSAGIDLSQRANLAITVDTAAPVVVNCAGAVPQKTLAGEIAQAINAALGGQVATQNGLTVTLTSRVTGPAGQIILGTAPADDALDLIFGFAPRRAVGADAMPATFTGTASLAGGADLRALQRVQVSVDDATPALVDFVAAGLGLASVTPDEIKTAINAAVGAPVASTDGTHLTLSSTAPGEQGSVAIVPIETTRLRPFVSRAFPADEASSTVLGILTASAQGSAGARATLTGAIELHDGLDLRGPHFLAIALDGGPPRSLDITLTIDRPYAVLLDEIVSAINHAFPADDAPGPASVPDGHLVLTSPTFGSAGSVSLAPGAGDAAPAIFGLTPQVVRGSDAQRVVFTGLADVSQPIDLSEADRVHLAIDGVDHGEFSCAGGDPAHTSAVEIIGLINAALSGTYASSDGPYLRLSSGLAGSAGSIAFLAPADRDATMKIFGIPSGRTYHGDDATSATLAGTRDLSASVDLSAGPWVRLAVDGADAQEFSCAGADPAHTRPQEIADKINAALSGAAAATVSDGPLVLTALSAGATSRIALEAVVDQDASVTLFGNATPQPGADPAPATVTGTIDLRTPVDLSSRSILRLAVDGARPVDIDVSGAAPDRTFGDEISSAIEAVLPGVSSIDPAGHLVLSSPTAGEESRLDVLPLRPIEVVEYPPADAAFGPQQVANGAVFTLNNDGAAEATVSFGLTSTAGLCGVDLVGLSTGVRVHVDAAAAPNAVVTVAAGADGSVDAAVSNSDGTSALLPPGRVVAAPEALAVVVPFEGARPLARSLPGSRRALALFDPLAGNVVLLESNAPRRAVGDVRVVPANPSVASPPPDARAGPLELLGILHAEGKSGELRDASGARIAAVRASAGVAFAPFDGVMVVVRGTWYPAGAASLLAVETIARLFKAEIGDAPPLPAVTLDPRTGLRSLTAQLARAGGPPVIARDVTPADAMRLPRGRSDWLLVQCDGARFDAARYDHARFAGGRCEVPGIFDISRFNATADRSAPGGAVTGELARFAPFGGSGPVSVTAAWQSYPPGAFAVNLPADLPASFGARFNAARFATDDSTSETYAGVVLDPPSDDHYIQKVLAASKLVSATPVTAVPLGWDPQPVPFRQPRTRYLTGGRADRPSAIYLQDNVLPRNFIGISAKANGDYGDDIAITVRYAGPAAFDITVTYPGARFECARAIASWGHIPEGGAPPPPSPADMTEPGPVGAVQAKAAGIGVTVTRERAKET